MSWEESKLSAQRVRIRSMCDHDLEDVFQGLSDPRVIRYYGVSFSSLSETKDQMKWYRDLLNDGTGIWWAVELNQNSEFIGAIGFNNIVKEHYRGEIGFWLYPEHWGNGYTCEILPVVINYAFNSMNLRRIEAWVEVGNSASSSVLLNAGFTHEGRFHNYEVKNGSPIDVDIFAIVRSGNQQN